MLKLFNLVRWPYRIILPTSRHEWVQLSVRGHEFY